MNITAAIDANISIKEQCHLQSGTVMQKDLVGPASRSANILNYCTKPLSHFFQVISNLCAEDLQRQTCTKQSLLCRS